MKLPPDVEFHEDIRLFVWRPGGVLNEAPINKVLSTLEELEAKLQVPFNRFTDTLAAHEVELSFKIHHSGFSPSTPRLRGPTAGEVSDPGD